MKIVIYATNTATTSPSHNTQIQFPKQDNARWYFSTLLNQLYQITLPTLCQPRLYFTNLYIRKMFRTYY